MLSRKINNNIIRQLQKEVINLQGFKRMAGEHQIHFGLGPIEQAFPAGIFPTSTIHEFISAIPEHSAATNGFLSAILSKLVKQEGMCMWVSTGRTIFPPALKVFGVDPAQVIFVDVATAKDALWATEEALKCKALTAVVGEFSELTFNQSRRLQLAVEESGVTSFIHRFCPRSINTVACAARWNVKPLPCIATDDLPGVSFPRWQVTLDKVRNGKPGTWEVEWLQGSFRHIPKKILTIPATATRKIS